MRNFGVADTGGLGAARGTGLHFGLIGATAKIGRGFAGDDAAVGEPGVALQNVIGIGIRVGVSLASLCRRRIPPCALRPGGG